MPKRLVRRALSPEHNHLIHGDCLEEMQSLPDKSIDMILCDLPYGTTACKWDSVIPLEPMWEQVKRISKRNAAVLLFGAQPFTSVLVASNLSMFKYEWVWKKTRPTGFLNAKKQPLRNIEHISVFYDRQPTYNPQMKQVKKKTFTRAGGGGVYGKQKGILPRTNNNGLEHPYTLLEFNSIKGEHPTQKPLDLVEYFVRTYSNENNTVLDFAMGSGTTGVACRNLGRRFIGIEKDKDFFNLAENRILGES